MMKAKKLLAIILSAIMILSSITTAGAIDILRGETVTDDSGSCGENIIYEFDSQQALLR